ncbi:hypothetical protein ACIOTI_32115 [Streptomyces sp. NPDC087843]
MDVRTRTYGTDSTSACVSTTVIALWRRMGLPTWQVNYGNF